MTKNRLAHQSTIVKVISINDNLFLIHLLPGDDSNEIWRLDSRIAFFTTPQSEAENPSIRYA